MSKLKGKNALVTGGSRGMGAAIVTKLAQEGVAFIGIHYGSNQEAAQAVLNKIRSLGSDGVLIQADLKEGKKAADKIALEYGNALKANVENTGLDILVNNAGIASALSLENTTDEDYESIMDVNFKSPFFLIQNLDKLFRNEGRIVNITTGFATRLAAPNHVIYAASKAALGNMSRSLAPYFGTRNITVNTVVPGYTLTDMSKDWLQDEQAAAFAKSQSVFGKIGTPEDIADAVALIVSPEAHWITGQDIDATGGARL
ncbi:SDR family NAD(P)-dependent oxidoreductase [Pedobacter chinensis]|uniref:SDR family NAD(P)-dependent oxidoreductase n=1 Tax=Pedobacter chinensis TaxID=2282421 RepID=A0A369PVS5_9SPHI|nr:SDR family oxidoreductase [Pedobacter chinensis]RDC56604.1 SDR family NAD(P)-dependent oxidoreductase [Pedobacter chinensis]